MNSYVNVYYALRIYDEPKWTILRYSNRIQFDNCELLALELHDLFFLIAHSITTLYLGYKRKACLEITAHLLTNAENYGQETNLWLCVLRNKKVYGYTNF